LRLVAAISLSSVSLNLKEEQGNGCVKSISRWAVARRKHVREIATFGALSECLEGRKRNSKLDVDTSCSLNDEQH
jgi:hypothetical protein